MRLLTLIPLLVCPAAGADTEAPKPPNIVFIYGDDHAQAAVGAYDSKLCTTPNIDSIAREGICFDQSFVTNAICGPSRAVVLTGVHSHLNGKLTNGSGFDDSLPTFATGLQAAGYQTAMVGKWHISSPPRGFDHWMWMQGTYYGPTWRTQEGNRKVEGYCTDLITAESVDWIEQASKEDQPFMIWISHKAAHRTWEPATRHLALYDDVEIPEPATLLDTYAGKSAGAAAAQMRIATDLFPAYDLKLPVTGEGILDKAAERNLGRMTQKQREAWDAAYGPKNAAFLESNLQGEALVRWKYQRYIKDYLRCVQALDEGVGRVLKTLDRLGLRDNTLVIYSSDQGFFLGEHGWYDKRWMYEPSFETPLMARWPGVIPAGIRSSALVQNLDMAPTLLDAAGAEIPKNMQGASLLGHMRGTPPDIWRDAVYYHYHQRDSGRTSHTVEPHYGLRTNQHKLIYVYGMDTYELYDLDSDPEEMNNLYGAEEHAGLFKDLNRRLTNLRTDLGDN